MLGLPPAGARIDFPSDKLSGSVTIDWGPEGANRDTARKALIAVILGGRVDGDGRGWDWPLDPDCVAPTARSDAEQALWLAERLGFDAVDWLEAIREANRFTRGRMFRRLVVAIADRLEEVEVLSQEELIRIHAQIEKETTECSV